MKIKKTGFSLIEVLIFVSILAVFFVTAAAVVTASLRAMKANEHRIIASHYAEELLDWLRSRKEEDWQIFTESIINDQKRCFNVIEERSSLTGSGLCDEVCSASAIGGIYTRCAQFKKEDNNPTTKVKVTVETSWNELGVKQYVPITSYFTIWE
ncbi:MAG: prepilin-type N-terminal cleavage/methylation domain-containing protein [Microgenomates group bacterium]|nr:prepilin-type N-terminal cleavage/methylation domain-containing protein [Microgenomates group bacterium]